MTRVGEEAILAGFSNQRFLTKLTLSLIVRIRLIRDRGPHVITGLVPVIPIEKSAALSRSGWPGRIPGSSPGTAMTAREAHDEPASQEEAGVLSDLSKNNIRV
jgi:hypothetical protein